MKQELVKRVEGIINKIDANEPEIILQLKKIVREYEMINYSNASSRILSLLYAGNLKSLNQNESVGLVKSGFADFDIKFGGFSLGEFVVLGGRPSMGKTQLLVNLCKNISKSTPVLYFTLGLSERMLTNRFMSSLANIPIDQIVQNNLSDHEKSKLSSLEKIAQEFHLYINDTEYDSISAFKAHCQEQIKSNDVKVIIVDCLQSIKSRIDGKKNNLTASALINELKGLVKEHNVLVIASSQLNKALESRGGDKRPQLSDLTDSGLLEEVADKVIFIFRWDYYGVTIDDYGKPTRGVAELMMVKNRNGKVGMVELLRDINFR